jgi:hypothetical protein
MEMEEKMTRDGLRIIQYLVSGEDSGTGRIDYWNGVFLAGRTPFDRICLELSKVFFVLVLSTGMMVTLTHICK